MVNPLRDTSLKIQDQIKLQYSKPFFHYFPQKELITAHEREMINQQWSTKQDN